MARILSQLELLEMIATESMGFNVRMVETNNPDMIVAKFEHPLGTITRLLPVIFLPDCLTQVCSEIKRFTH